MEEFGKAISIKQMVYNYLKEKIIKGELKPGSRLLEAELAEQMDISRAPIREAFNMLEKDGFTKIIPRKGAIVSEVTEEHVFSIWEFRILIEPYVARKTFSYITEEEIAEIEKKITYVKNNPEDFRAYMESDIELHDLLCKYLDNSFMAATLENIKAHSLRIRWEDEFSEEGGRTNETPIAVNQEHENIVIALKSKDERKVYQTVLEHVLNSTQRIMRACNMELTKDQQERIKIFREELEQAKKITK